MLRIKVKTTGLAAAQKKAASNGRAAANAFAAALYAEALHIMADSVARVPVVTGRLRNSQFVTLPGGGKRFYLRFGYGTKYAYRVHEGIVTRMAEMSDKQRRGAWAAFNEAGGVWKKSTVGGPHYLRNAVNATEPGRRARIERTMKRYAARGIGINAVKDPSMKTAAAGESA